MKWTLKPDKKFEQPKKNIIDKIYKKIFMWYKGYSYYEEKELGNGFRATYYSYKANEMSTKEKLFWAGILIGGLLVNIIWVYILSKIK